MTEANIYCDDCEKWFKVEYKQVSDLPEMICPICKKDNIWFGDIETEDNEPLVMGRGGCSQK